MMLIEGPFKYITDKAGNAKLACDIGGDGKSEKTLEIPAELVDDFFDFIAAIQAAEDALAPKDDHPL